MKNKIKMLFIGFIIIFFVNMLHSEKISNTKHNLSVSGPGTVKATSETEICIFCHTPHAAAKTPLWNRNDPGLSFTLYTSSTTNASIGQPDGSSIMCLSCHDGTIALGSVVSRTSTISFGSVTTMPTGNTNLTKNMTNDHPVSFVYSSALATADGQLLQPGSITPPVSLYNTKVQCTSCHNPHENTSIKFLVTSSQNSALCVSCHNRTYWANSTHKTSTKTWNGTAPNPWFHTPWTTVAANACENCHTPHNAGGAVRNMNYSAEETNCLNCHNGNVASTNIQSQLTKTYRHKVANYTGVHDPTEANIVTTQHVECVDCHNGHASNATTASAPNVRGSLLGVKGVDTDGNNVNPSLYQYQICYKCHSSSSWRPGSPTTRQIAQNNVRLEFDPANPAFHPIESAGPNANVPSLISPWTTTSKMYCSDCHASDGTGVPKGPHGSTYAQILVKQYMRGDNVSESAANYALCYTCHSRTSILGDNSFKEHNKHIAGENFPCNNCHDPHGISSTQGNSTNNSNLINFNTAYITPSSGGILRFDDQGLYKGRCYLTCHGKNHNPLSY